MTTVCNKMVAILVASLLALPCVAADLDEIYRPLEAQGQTLWDFGLTIHDDWQKGGTSYGAYYNANRFLTPVVSVDVGLTDKLRLSAGGSYTDYSPSWVNSQNLSTTGLLALTYRPTQGFQASLTYATSYSGARFSAWDPRVPDTSSQGITKITSDNLALSVSWLSHPTPSYKLLVPDLNGLTAPLVDPRQSLLWGTLSVSRNHYSQTYDSYNGTRHDFDHYHVGGDKIESLDLGWRYGLGAGWETGLDYKHTNPHDETRSLVIRGYLQPPISSLDVGSTSDVDDLAATLRRRWGQTLQITGGLGYSRHTESESRNGIVYPGNLHLSTWNASVEVIALTRPHLEGHPLARDLNGFTSPLLDPGQVRWDGRLEWSQDRYRFEYHNMGVTNYAFYYPAQLKLLNAVTFGLTKDVQLKGTFNLFPSRYPSPLPDEWSHYTATAAVIYRPKPSWELKASYEVAYDYHPWGYDPWGFDLATERIFQTFRFGASVVW